MTAPEEQDAVLPFTPTNTGRRSRIGYFGFEGADFADLWPLFAGTVGTVALVLAVFIGGRLADASLAARSILCALPFAGGYSYLRLFVQGRPPHFKADLWTEFVALRLDPAGGLSATLFFLPAVRSTLGVRGMGGADDHATHPLAGPRKVRNRRHG